MGTSVKKHLIFGSERWLNFLENTAEGLHLSLTLFSTSPNSSAITVPERCPICKCKYPLITAGDILKAGNTKDKNVLEFTSQEGLCAIVLPLEKDLQIIISGCPHCSNQLPVSLHERAVKAQILLSKFLKTLIEGIEGGHRALELSTLRQMNHIVLNFFHGGPNGMEYAFNLLLSALVILLDAKGSWLEYEEAGIPTLSVQGDRSLVEQYRNQPVGKEDSVIIIKVRNGNTHGLLGVLEPGDFKRAATLLPLLAEECAIVYEIDKLFKLVQNQMTKVLGTINSGVLIVNRFGDINYLNKACAHILGKTEMELLGCSAFNLSTPWTPYYQERKNNEASMDCLDTANQRLYISWQMSPLYEGEEFSGWIVLVSDQTAYYNWQMVSRKADRFASTALMVGSLAHELRNPIGAAKNLVQAITRKQDPNKVRSYAQLVLQELDRVSALLNEFLLLGKPADISLEPLYPKQFITELIPLLEEEAAAHEVSILFELEDTPAINADQGQLTQVVLNLVRNALEAVKENGCVRLYVKKAEKEVILAVLDNGAGLPLGKEDKIFQPFFSTKQKGTGLGLPIVQAIVNNHGGRITAKNSSGGGARFTVSFPFSKMISFDNSTIDFLLIMPDQIEKLAIAQSMREEGYTVVSMNDIAEETMDNINPRIILLHTPSVKTINQLSRIWPTTKILVLGGPHEIPRMSNVEFLEGDLDFPRLICRIKRMLIN